MPRAGTATSKRCSRCNEERGLSDFHVRRASHDGLQPFCKLCAQTRARDYRDRYSAVNRTRDVRVATTSKQCRQCRVTKPAAEFALHTGQKDGLSSVCHRCASAGNKTYYEAHRERVKARNREWAKANPERVAANQRRVYQEDKRSGKRHALNLAQRGLSVEQYEALLEAQGGVCAICGGIDVRRRLNVDHDHVTGTVRGLLCSGCNGARVGRLGDSPERAEARARHYEERAGYLRRAAEYLRNPPAETVLKAVD